MATVNSITFDQPAYTAGSMITAAVNYTPDAPTSTAQTFTMTATLSDAAGNAVATNTAPFVVNTVNANAETLAVSDDGSHTWVVGAAAAQADGSETSDCTTTA